MFTDIVYIKDKARAIDIGRRLGFGNIIFIDKDYLINNIKDIKKQKPVIVIGGNEKINRDAVSSRKVDILLSPELDEMDSLHFVKSGLNHVLCKLAHDNNVSIGINFNRILNGEADLGKIMENIRLCKQYNVKIVLASFANNIYEMRSVKDLISLGVVLGLTPLDAKNSLINNSK